MRAQLKIRLCGCAFLALVHAIGYGAMPALPVPKMTYLDNGEVRIGMDLALGGAVTFISSKDHPGNIINSADLGRQIQMSHYSGPSPFEVGDQKPHPAWAGLGWNPIQTGDCYMNPARVVDHRNDGKKIYIKCIPMQWPLDNVPGDCVFETSTTLEGPVIHMRFRCTNQRADKTQYPPCPQELPAVYTISKLCRLMSYTGDKPFTGDKLTHVINDWRQRWPWTRFTATERWAALVDDTGWGLGVFKDDGGEFHGGIYGDERSDDTKHSSTAYVAPVHMENLDHNIIYEHRTEYVVGRLDDIRARFNQMATKTLPAWHFTRDRQHWTIRNATDQGFPLRGEWRIKCGDAKPRLQSGTLCWYAQSAPVMVMNLAFSPGGSKVRVYWKRLDDDRFDATKSILVKTVPGSGFSSRKVDLAASPEYRGLITGLAIEPDDQPQAGAELAIKSIVLTNGRN